MLRIGYINNREAVDGDLQALQARECRVVRIESDPCACPVLEAVLGFLGVGDELVAPRLTHLGRSAEALRRVLERLDAAGATLLILDPELRSSGDGGRALRAAFDAMAASPQPRPQKRQRGPGIHDEILALHREGVGPVTIARRLGVSRMTVWRRLKDLDDQA